MATNFKPHLPIIDISPLLVKCNDPDMMDDTGVAEVVQKLDRACRDVGFFYVQIGHGISESLMRKVKEMTHRFFELPYEEKLKIKITPAAGYRIINGVELHRGYQRIGVNYTSGKQDFHEAIDVSGVQPNVLNNFDLSSSCDSTNMYLFSYGQCYREFKQGKYGETGKVLEGLNQWPENPQEYKGLMDEYIKLCTDLSRNILRGISLALGGSPYEFEGEMVGDPFWVMRIIGYPGVNQENKNGFRFYFVSEKVKNLAGDWVSAIPIPGSFICNIGDMLKILSNGVYESTLHRVINNSPLYRVCIAFFYETNFDAMVEPLDIFKEKYPGDKRSQDSKRVVYGEHLVNKVQTTFANLVEYS
ncbi:LOW QUALITY PROTEIN: hypothetical protein YC2023_070890 [Brassica napus]